MLLNATVQEAITIDRDRFNLLEAYISTVESPCTVDSTSSNLRLLPWLGIGIVSTLPRFPLTVLRVVSTPRVFLPEWISHPLRLVPGSALHPDLQHTAS